MQFTAEINDITQVISSVYFVPGLKNNLLSVGQLQQKGLRITIEDDMCEVWHKQQGRMLMHSVMSMNRMFVILAKVMEPRDIEANQVQDDVNTEEEIWHCRFGHLNHQSLSSLYEKKMVTWLPRINHEDAVCEVNMKGKQNRVSIPK